MTKIVTDDMRSFIVEDNARKATGSDYLDDDAPAVQTNGKTSAKLFVDGTVIIIGMILYFL